MSSRPKTQRLKVVLSNENAAKQLRDASGHTLITEKESGYKRTPDELAKELVMEKFKSEKAKSIYKFTDDNKTDIREVLDGVQETDQALTYIYSTYASPRLPLAKQTYAKGSAEYNKLSAQLKALQREVSDYLKKAKKIPPRTMLGRNLCIDKYMRIYQKIMRVNPNGRTIPVKPLVECARDMKKTHHPNSFLVRTKDEWSSIIDLLKLDGKPGEKQTAVKTKEMILVDVGKRFYFPAK